ncbi:class I SAM-dependent methyltransferase [Xanthomonas prunicola]|uniref:Class I SAM-dependent methyltransferase n=1 Tax=Xanthomonas prunicola TaxID=2053930 RepID=A0A9Q9IV99_9XANT|nr:class I SAM-dependent methyltransferase [Xanthomonas prunicola]UXA47618.1 class I SAM-dependent methyltransferase [Xanthomonas prunicola]UXA56080.1 class I SAM-dependent methyltransferase [Xanthomonas prunicola]UXA62055.1 class I SAM-dependent methyltransferase [Xanthomonas prunicola]UXA64250.1 class I SAM-dependent methyltransferase [Xanthomonas prunicola]
MDDQQWYERLLRSINDSSLGLPGFPSVYQQEVFVGKSNEVALAEAFTFYKIVKSGSYPLQRSSRVLDFGVGWGRIIRFFLNDVGAPNLHGVDVDDAILEVARSTGVRGNLSQIGPNARLPYNDSYFDVVYAFSVFSHLSAASATFWLSELMRVLRPGGTLVMTTTTDHFLELCQACSLKGSGRNQYEEDYARMFADPAEARRRYAAGEHVYAAVAGNADVLQASNYGWAAMPPAFVEREIGPLAESVTFVDDPSVLPQGYFTVRKHADLAQRIARKLRSLVSE